jgi:predicted PurR-regulated permease PerM
MSRSLNLSPFLIFVVMIIGATIGWVLGIILAVPATAIGHVIYTNYRNMRNQKNKLKSIPKVTKKVTDTTI